MDRDPIQERLPHAERILLHHHVADPIEPKAGALEAVQALREELAAGQELRVFVDASLLEIYRSGGVATTLRIYPQPGEELRVAFDGDAIASAWRLALPEA